MFGRNSSFHRYKRIAYDYILSLERAATVPAPKPRETRALSQLGGIKASDATHLPPEYIAITGYVESTPRFTLFILLSVMSFGILAIVAKWYPVVWCVIARARCTSFRNAQFVMLAGPDGNTVEIPIITSSGFVAYAGGMRLEAIRYFEYRKQRYIYEEVFSSFQRQNPRLNDTFANIHNMRYGKTNEEAETILRCNGPNTINIGSTSAYTIVLDKIAHPFYIFQFASVVIWVSESYISYALLIFVLSLCSIVWEVYSAQRNEAHLRQLAHVEAVYPVMRDGELKYLDAAQLVVGDAIILSAASDPLEGTTVICDMVLIQGECVMDESSLTGESIPTVKLPLPFASSDSDPTTTRSNPTSNESLAIPAQYHRNNTQKRRQNLSSDRHRQHILFCGSKFVEIKSRKNWMELTKSDGSLNEPDMAIAIVIATGFASSKGELFRSILFPMNIIFKFRSDSMKFLAALGLVATAAFLNRMVQAIRDGTRWYDAIISSLDLVTIAVPPALPLILTVGVSFSLERLKEQLVYCIAPNRINYAGRIDLMCWDKTGTLTVPSLLFKGLDRAEHRMFKGLSTNLKSCILSEASNASQSMQAHVQATLDHVMILCHGVVRDSRGQLLGHSLDIEMVNTSGWQPMSASDLDTLSASNSLPIVCAMIPNISSVESAFATDQPHSTSHPMLILRRFEFDSHLQRSSTLATIQPTTSSCMPAWHVLTKGSPESVRHICNPDTIPADYFDTCQDYAVQGYYVVACASRTVSTEEFPEKTAKEIATARRETVERGLTFLGFLIFGNPLKSEASETVSSLRQAKIRSVILELGLCHHALLIDLHDNQPKFCEVPYPRQLRSSPLHSQHDPSSAQSSQGSHQLQTHRQHASANQQSSSLFSLNSSDKRKFHPMEDLVHCMSSMPAQTEIAITGDALGMLCQNLEEIDFVDWVVGRCRIFSRVKPDQKTWIVERLIRLGKYVGMCGDGTNDCGALKAAHVGLALSDAEASIVAPFTSAKKSVTDALLLVREGRCALETSFIAFRYMTLYPIIQLMMSAYLNQLHSALSNNQFLFDDMFIVTALSLTMLYSKPTTLIVPERPTDNLFSPTVLASIGGHIVFAVAFFALNAAVTFSQPWFCSIATATSMLNATFQPINSSLANSSYPCYPLNPHTDIVQSLVIKSHENTSIWTFTHFMFAIIAIIITLPSHFRQPIHTNTYFTLYASTIICTLIALLLLVTNSSTATSPDQPEFDNVISMMFSVQPGVPTTFRFGQLGLLCLYVVAAGVWEIYVVDDKVRQYARESELQRIQQMDWARDRAVGIENLQARGARDIRVPVGVESERTNLDEEEDGTSFIDDLAPMVGNQNETTTGADYAVASIDLV
eukprot:jgi/Hompol1/6769/HPOL_000625-RA